MIRVGIVGAGAIGSVVADALASGRIACCELSGVLRRDGSPAIARQVETIQDLIAGSDLVLEAAGHDAVADHGPAVISAGRDLLVTSVGALVDDELRSRLVATCGPGRLLLSAGAIGGLGLFRAAALMGELDEVRLVTTKPPGALIAEWMDDELRASLETAEGSVVAFNGSARDAVVRFPASINVAATLALSTVGFDRTEVEVIGDPRTTSVVHEILVDGAAGRYELRIRNTPSANPRTSAITPFNVIRALADLSDPVVVGL